MSDTSHLNWARKYRPRNLQEYIGDEVKTKISSRLSKKENYPRVMLLEGTRGSGKTSLAELICKEMLCENKIDGHACCECDMCKELDEMLLFADNGSTTNNVMEVDVAMDGGKKAVESIIDEMDIAPMYGDYKICILDECHRLTESAQNALLKRFEDPQRYEVYILCTTDPDDLLQPIKSRCEVDIKVRPANSTDLVNRLLEISEKEKLRVDKQALKLIVEACDRNPRESILKLEDLAKSNGGEITREIVMRETGTIEAGFYMDFFNAANKGLEDIVKFRRKIEERNISPGDFIRGITKFTLECINIKLGIGWDKFQKEYIDSVKKFFGTYNAEDLDCLLQILEYSNKTVNSDTTMADLLLLTLGLRIGKIKLLAVGLHNEQAQAEKETSKGNKLSVELKESERESSCLKTSTLLDNALVASAYGTNIVEVKGGTSLLDLDDSTEDDTDYCSDDDILKDLAARLG